MLRLSLGGLLILAAANIASATDGNGLLSKCEQLERTAVVSGNTVYSSGADASACYAYFEGYKDAMFFASGMHACIPLDVQPLQLARVFLHDARTHPAGLHLPASVLVSAWLARAFPCSSQPAAAR